MEEVAPNPQTHLPERVQAEVEPEEKNPMQIPFCAKCYKQIVGAAAMCEKCEIRKYCSTECRKQDWKLSHELFCGESGEIGVDFEVRNAGNKKGLGTFALRNFKRGEKIMAESRLNADGLTCVPETAQWLVDTMVPAGGTYMEKLLQNALAVPAQNITAGLFVNLGRLNHDCIGNCWWIQPKEGLPVYLTANRDIAAGEELTFPYALCRPIITHNRFRHRARRLARYGIDPCECKACTDPRSMKLVDELIRLNDSIDHYFNFCGNTEKFFLDSERLIEIFDELGMSLSHYAMVYSTMFDAAVSSRATLGRAKQFYDSAYKYALLRCGERLKNYDDKVEYLEKRKDFKKAENYLILDRFSPY